MSMEEVGPSKGRGSVGGIAPIWVGLAIVFFFPLGLYLLWRHPTLGRTPKWWAVGGGWSFLVLVGAINGDKDRAKQGPTPSGGDALKAVSVVKVEAQAGTDGRPRPEGTTAPGRGFDYMMTDEALIAEFDGDEVAADEKYKGKTLRVLCEKWAAGGHPDAAYYAGLGDMIKVVEEPIPGKPYTRNRTIYADHTVVCLFGEPEAESFRALPRGRKRYALIGKYAGVKGGHIDGHANGGKIRLIDCRAEIDEGGLGVAPGLGEKRTKVSPVGENKIPERGGRGGGGPPFVPPTQASPRVTLQSEGCRLAPRGRVWEQRIAYHAICFSPDSKTLAVGGSRRQGFVNPQGVVLMIDTESGSTRLAMQELHEGQIRCIAFSPDGRSMVTGSGDGTVGAWGTGPPDALARFKFTHPDLGRREKGHEVLATCFSADGRRLFAAGGLDSSPPIVGTLTAWAYPSGEEVFSVHPGHRLVSASLSKDGRTLATGSVTGRVEFWNPDTGQGLPPVIRTSKSDAEVYVRYSPKGDCMAVGVKSFDESPYEISLHDLRGREEATTRWMVKGPNPLLRCLAFSP